MFEKHGKSIGNNLALFVLLIFVITPASIVWCGYALSVVWGWFVVPLFGFPALGIAQAAGLYLVVSYMTTQYIKMEARQEDDWSACVHTFLKPAVLLALGYAVKQFI